MKKFFCFLFILLTSCSSFNKKNSTEVVFKKIDYATYIANIFLKDYNIIVLNQQIKDLEKINELNAIRENLINQLDNFNKENHIYTTDELEKNKNLIFDMTKFKIIEVVSARAVNTSNKKLLIFALQLNESIKDLEIRDKNKTFILKHLEFYQKTNTSEKGKEEYYKLYTQVNDFILKKIDNYFLTLKL